LQRYGFNSFDKGTFGIYSSSGRPKIVIFKAIQNYFPMARNVLSAIWERPENPLMVFI